LYLIIKEEIVRNFVLPVILLFALSFGGCIKNHPCTPKPASSESPEIIAYALANGINATAHSSGLYYEVISPGSGTAVSSSSKIVITYTGALLNGTVFANQTSPNTAEPWDLGELIEGWKVGIPLIQKGGHIRLLVPSALAYGCRPYGAIPGNSVLVFDITLVDVL
jgi:FKBP-type peptidyl-prolyl cis-trans isomerase FkpA